jgi:hypothetical protein
MYIVSGKTGLHISGKLIYNVWFNIYHNYMILHAVACDKQF